MGKTLVISGHPKLDETSVANRVIIERLKKLPDCEIRDLKKLYPDFKIDVKAEQQALIEADTVVLQFPFYWYSVPGIMKEWLDEVFSYGFAYGSTGDKLRGKRLIISTTIGGSGKSYTHEGHNGYEVEELLNHLKQTANLTGMIFSYVCGYGMMYIPNVYNIKEEVEKLARRQAEELVAAIADN